MKLTRIELANIKNEKHAFNCGRSIFGDAFLNAFSHTNDDESLTWFAIGTYNENQITYGSMDWNNE